MELEVITRSSEDTQKVAASFTRFLLANPSKRAQVLALVGDLGSGKTTFIQGLARALGIKDTVLSPTFLIIKEFNLENKNFKHFYHIDVYRLKNPQELLDLGFKDVVEDPANLIVIEWADKIEKILPPKIIKVEFQQENSHRKILFKIPE